MIPMVFVMLGACLPKARQSMRASVQVDQQQDARTSGRGSPRLYPNHEQVVQQTFSGRSPT